MERSATAVLRTGRVILTSAVALMVLHAGLNILPSDAVFGVVTPLRLVVLAGICAVGTVLLTGGGPSLTIRTRLDLPILGIVAAALLSVLVTGQGAPGLRDLLTVAGGYYLVVAQVRLSATAANGIGTVASLVVGAAGGVALAQVAHDVPTGFCRSARLADVGCSSAGSLVRAIGTFANPNLLAAFVVLLGPLALLHAWSARTGQERVTGIVLVVAGYGGLIVTYSRSGWVAALAGLLVLGLAVPRTGRPPSRRVIAAGTGVVVAAGVVLGVLSWGGGSLGVRQEIWRSAVRIGLHHPAGAGLDRAGPALDTVTASGIPVVHAHNLWLNWLAEAGLPGLAAITLLTAGAVLVAAGQAARGSRTSAAALAGLTGFLLISLLDDPANLNRIWLAFWLLMAAGAAPAPGRWRTGRRSPDDAGQTEHARPALHPVGSGEVQDARARPPMITQRTTSNTCFWTPLP